MRRPHHMRGLRTPLAGRSREGRWKQQLVISLLFPLILVVAWMQWKWVSEQGPQLFRMKGTWFLERIPCDVCGQTGFLTITSSGRSQRVICPVCMARGAYFVRRTSTLEKLCPACGGLGRVFDEPDSAHWCERCGGRGLVQVEESELHAEDSHVR